jgi:hypothetical protein
MKKNWRILTNKEIYAAVKKPTITETIRLHRLHWFGHVRRTEENRIPKIWNQQDQEADQAVNAIVKKPTITETIGYRLHWFGHVQRMEENIIP